uniref:Putative secreted peptide n=1 Tax=Anopheles braziliensis TaxID=58242 RepID=A0A2M3ZUW6_9DIPT
MFALLTAPWSSCSSSSSAAVKGRTHHHGSLTSSSASSFCSLFSRVASSLASCHFPRFIARVTELSWSSSSSSASGME